MFFFLCQFSISLVLFVLDLYILTGQFKLTFCSVQSSSQPRVAAISGAVSFCTVEKQVLKDKMDDIYAYFESILFDRFI